MKCTIPEISWHNRDPVLSVDIQPFHNDEFYRLATGGTDCHVLIWYLKIRGSGAVDVDIVSDLTRHQKAVNVVRWSPSGQYLATGDDDANIIVWNLKTDSIPLLDGETSDKETWVINKVLRGHKEDVYDICWSPNGLKLISGSIDNTAILWDFTKGLNEHILSDHKGFVQGVTWDPKGQYIATLSSDRVCRVFDNTGKHIKVRAHKGLLPLRESHALFNKEIKYFHDDTFKSYFRRLTFSPDGSLLIAPSGCIETEDCKAVRHTTLIFTLDCLTQPAAILPSPKQVTIAVRCCPILFELHSEGTDPIVVLPYRIIIAVATDSDIVLYDTQQFAPFAHLQKVHYTRITDLTWSSDGLLLIASSTDGYCTLVTFEPNELGVQYVKDETEAEDSVLDVSDELNKTELSNKKNEKEQIETKIKKPNILEQWAIRKNKSDIIEEVSNQSLSKTRVDKKPSVPNEEQMEVSDKIASKVLGNESLKTTRKRIAPIKIADEQKKQKLEKSCVVLLERCKEEKSANKITEENKKKQNVEAIPEPEVFINKSDIIILDDDCSLIKESESEISSLKGDQSNVITPSRKRKKDTKKIHTPIKNSPLLKFLQAAQTKCPPKIENTDINPIKKENIYKKADISKHLIAEKVIEISDDESNDKSNTPNSEKSTIDDSEQSTNSDLENATTKFPKTLNIIEIDDSDTNTSVNDLGEKKGSMETEAVLYINDSEPYKNIENEIKETSNKVPTQSKTVESLKENIKTEKISAADEVVMTESELKSNIDKGNVSTTPVVSEKENLEAKEIVCVDAPNSNKDADRLCKKTSVSGNTLPIKIATPKIARRIALVTLSSPKRKKKM